MNDHSLSIEQTAARLETSLQSGLSTSQAQARLAEHGPNALPDAKPRCILLRFLSQFADFMILILFLAAGISFGVSVYEGNPDFFEPLIIFAIIVLNALMGTIQETKAEHSLAALKKLSAPKATVIRNGNPVVLDSTELVPGDLLVLEAGQILPADCRLSESVNLNVSESSLTGESVPIFKDANALLPSSCPLAERINCVYSSCIITAGHGKALVTATGTATEIGQIASHLLQAAPPDTPLQKRLSKVSKVLGLACILICIGVFGLGTLQGRPPISMLLTAVSLAVAAIPEGLPAVVTIMLSIGVERMVRQNAIIRRLPAVETLGSATYICSDKTGTLTQNRMQVAAAYAGNCYFQEPAALHAPSLKALFLFAALCCNSDGLHGEPTENAIVSAAGHFPAPDGVKRVYEYPFSSERKAMAVICRMPDGTYRLIAKGACDVLLPHCIQTAACSGDAMPFSLAPVQKANQTFAKAALRVLAVCSRTLSRSAYDAICNAASDDKRFSLLFTELTFEGLLALCDPPRPECKKAVSCCRQAGITPVMITGDHPLTAYAIAKELGIAQNTCVMTGTDLDTCSDAQLSDRVSVCHVFARVRPEHKVRIVQALQNKGEVVAMTGDGVNDAPALRHADIGCAMGMSGTDVAAQASDMILMDDNFATIVSAIRIGRGIYDNIRKSIHFLLSCNAGEILLIVLCLLFGLNTPLIAIQLLWINLVTDSLPAIALAMEPPEPDIMRRRPLPRDTSLFTKEAVCRIVLEGLMIALLSFLAFQLYGRTCCFLVLGSSELIHTLNIKNDRSLCKSGLFENSFLTGAVLLGILLQAAAVFFAPMRFLFGTALLPRDGLLAALILSLVPIVIVELEKALLGK